MTQREVCSKIFDVLNKVHSSTIPVTASTDLVEVAKRELIDAINNWNSGASPEPVIGALFLLQTSGAISVTELEQLTDLVEQAQ